MGGLNEKTDKDVINVMTGKELKLFKTLDANDASVFKKFLTIIKTKSEDLSGRTAEIIKDCLTNPDMLIEALSWRGSIDSKSGTSSFTRETLDKALNDIDKEDTTIYKIHDLNRLGGLLTEIGLDHRHLKKSDILKYEAIVFYAINKTQESYASIINQLCSLESPINTSLATLIENKTTEIIAKRDQIKQIIYPILYTKISEDIYDKTLKDLNRKLKEDHPLTAAIIRDNINQLFTKKDPFFSVPELTNILRTVHHKLENPLDNDNSLNDAAEKISHHAKADRKFQKLKAGLIIFSASCLLVAAAAATVFSFGLLAPITLPTMVAATAAITAAVPLAGYHVHRFNEIKAKYRLSLKELANDDQQTTLTERHKHASFDSDEGHTTDEDNSEDNSRPSSPK